MGYPFAAPNGDEESLNQQFAGYLHYSLQYSPELLNEIHSEQPVSFSKEARLIADQDSPLPRYTDEGTNRKIDWVIGDSDKLVGYESKYGALLRSDQLRDELAKLRVNADDRDAALFVFTMHTTPPGLIDGFADEPVYWMSWFTVYRRLHQLADTELSAEQRPIRQMLTDLFEAEDMHPFTGFDHQDKLQYRYFIRDLREELNDTELQNPGTVNTSPSKSPEPSSWKRMVPKTIDIPFIRESRDGDWTRQTSYLTVLVDTETHDVHVGIVFNVREVESHRMFLDKNLDEILDDATRQNRELWASVNSLNSWTSGIAKTGDPVEMRSWLENGSTDAVQVGETSYKKAIFVRKCVETEPAALVQETKRELLELYNRFLAADNLYPRPTLNDYE